MERKDFLKGLGVLGIGSLIPATAGIAGTKRLIKSLKDGEKLQSGTCILIPQETAGPYPFNLSGNAAMFRQDITEGNAGTPLNLTLTLVNINNGCSPIANARIDIWHCNKDGYYSEYNNQPGYLGTGNYSGQTFFRGIQMTDANGLVQFTTIYPGWYSGRVTHIHFQVFLSSVLSATSQMAFPDGLNTAVYNTALYTPHGQNPTVNSNDNVFSDTANTQYETVTIAANSSGGYDASLVIGIAAPVTGLVNIEPETGGQFKLYAVYPNPVSESATITFDLINTSKVKMEIFNTMGAKVLELINANMQAGKQEIVLNRKGNAASLSDGNYLYQLTVENENGIFHQCKVLTLN